MTAIASATLFVGMLLSCAFVYEKWGPIAYTVFQLCWIVTAVKLFRMKDPEG
jgi:hypothetical protein